MNPVRGPRKRGTAISAEMRDWLNRARLHFGWSAPSAPAQEPRTARCSRLAFRIVRDPYWWLFLETAIHFHAALAGPSISPHRPELRRKGGRALVRGIGLGLGEAHKPVAEALDYSEKGLDDGGVQAVQMQQQDLR